MATIPATPTFTTASTAGLTSLSALSTLVALGSQYELAWKVYKNTIQNVGSGVTAPVTFQGAAWNPDTNWSASTTSQVTIETQGYYALNSYLNFDNTTSSGTINAWYTITHSGTTTSFGTSSQFWPVQLGLILAMGCVVPQLCQVGDTISLEIMPVGRTIALAPVGQGQNFNGYNTPGSSDYAGINDGGCWFSGRLLSIGGTP